MIVVIVIIALAGYLGVNWYFNENTKDAQAVVLIDGKETECHSLKQDGTYKISAGNGRFNVLVISNGEADMKDASCPDKICVRHKPIHKTGETLVCLPNKVVVEIKNAKVSDVDTSTN